MQKTNISYLTHSWNPIAMRCTPCSPGCRQCWHLAMCDRHATNPVFPPDIRKAYAGGPPVLKDWELEAPLCCKKPARIGVLFMGDLFHEDIPFEQIDRIFAIPPLCPQHTFIYLTKRAERMKEYLYRTGDAVPGGALDHDLYSDWRYHTKSHDHEQPPFPLPNVHLGATVENQEMADERIQFLLDTPAAVRFLSIEPMIGPVDVTPYFSECIPRENAFDDSPVGYVPCVHCGGFTPLHKSPCPGIDGIILGGESCPKRTDARPMNVEWARSVRDQCKEAGVSFFMKQMSGARPELKNIPQDLQIKELP